MSNSNQNIETPWPFIRAVEAYFGIRFKFDMAADRDNHKAASWYGPEADSLGMCWPTTGWCWLNPPFKRLTPWINKCHEQMNRGCKIISIWPLSGDQNQIVTWKYASVYILHGRVWPEVRGCMLCKWDKDNVGPIRGLTWDKEKLMPCWSCE